MSDKPVLCIQVNEETQLRLLEERHVEEYFALIERNQEHLHEWIAVEAYEGSVETLRAYVKQRLLQFVNGEGYHLGIWYQEALVGVLDYRLNWRGRKVELGYWLDAAMEGKGMVTQACRTMVRHAFEEHELHKVEISCATDNTAVARSPSDSALARKGFSVRRIGFMIAMWMVSSMACSSMSGTQELSMRKPAPKGTPLMEHETKSCIK